jgi:hypothetical protein
VVQYVTKVWSDVPPGLAPATTARKRSNSCYLTIRLPDARSNVPAQTLAGVTGSGALRAPGRPGRPLEKRVATILG